MPDEGSTALATTAPSDTTPSDTTPRARDLSLVPSLDTEDRPVFPVSMVVHGGTGIMHGNMTSLTVNQYIGVVPNHGGAWDSGKVRELMADAVKVSADANSQLFHPEAIDSPPTSGYQGKILSKKRRKNSCLFLIAGLVLLCVVPLGAMAVYTEFFSPDPVLEPFDTAATTSPPIEVENFVVDPANREDAPGILPRTYWLAQSPRRPLKNNTLPVYMVVVADTRTEECFKTTDCVFQLRAQQTYDLNFMKYDDIGFNFLISGDGNVYTGRGWDSRGDHTEGYDTGTLGVAFVGTFSRSLPKDVQLTAFNKLMKTGVEINKISADYVLVNHCQLRSDGYSDLALAENMTSWPHFDNSFPITNCALNETEHSVL